ncbi:UNVERIFIED_CONTAM: hypothetical protein Sradi_0395000 [Sesamum radiatum]|uniref:RING-type domain-containing protein n=1 Tax=Sesamum radiatum TaxID=300843 RepID=A0AAW2W9P4_SESRA
MSKDFVEMKALIAGLEVAVVLDLGEISIVTDNPILHQIIGGQIKPAVANFATLSDQITLLLRKLTEPYGTLVDSGDIKFAFELSRKAIALQVNRSAGNSNAENMTESCTICLEDTYVDQMFLITGCQHRYCISCMSRHVQFKLLQAILPKCPHENCNSDLKLDSCQKFLTPELFDIMSQHVKEASIPQQRRFIAHIQDVDMSFAIRVEKIGKTMMITSVVKSGDHEENNEDDEENQGGER